jgi:hypothetical protein
MIKQALSKLFDISSKGFSQAEAASIATLATACVVTAAGYSLGVGVKDLYAPFHTVAGLSLISALGCSVLKDMSGSVSEMLVPRKLGGPQI